MPPSPWYGLQRVTYICNLHFSLSAGNSTMRPVSENADLSNRSEKVYGFAELCVRRRLSPGSSCACAVVMECAIWDCLFGGWGGVEVGGWGGGGLRLLRFASCDLGPTPKPPPPRPYAVPRPYGPCGTHLPLLNAAACAQAVDLGPDRPALLDHHPLLCS